MQATSYTLPDYIPAPESRYDVAANMAHFLMANGHGIFDRMRVRMSAKDQRRVFGLYLGRGTIVIDGENDRVANRSTTCFGGDSEETVWMDCPTGTVGRNFFSAFGTKPRELEIEAAQVWF